MIHFHEHGTVIVGAGAAGMNCAVHLFELLRRRGIADAAARIAVVTGGIGLGASRMAGSDKQTYYKIGTGPGVPDCALAFAETLRAGGCCHGDLALAEGIGSLREFHHLVRAGVPFPTDALGAFVGYKTDHDPAERATSAGPRTSRMMSERLQAEVEAAGIRIFDGMEVADLVAIGEGRGRRIAGVATLSRSDGALHLFLAGTLVLAAGGPGALYRTTVYPEGQVGIHGLALRAGMAAENLTESQFGMASVGFRWNVSGTYMQALPRIFSTGPDGGDERDFLGQAFRSTGEMASRIFLKGYQWPFDPARVADRRSSLIDLLVFGETRRGRRVFLDYRTNPAGPEPFRLDDLEARARDYLARAGALLPTPIERLAHMNPPAIEVFRENGVDLTAEPVEVAVCAQHMNGGFAVDRWWESTVPGTFVVGEMAGTHGVKRPGGSALNAGQVGGLRAAERIAAVHAGSPPRREGEAEEIDRRLAALAAKLDRWSAPGGADPEEVLARVQGLMTASAGHVREAGDARRALEEALALCNGIEREGLRAEGPDALVAAIRAEHLALAGAAVLTAVVALLERGGGSRGSHLVLAEDGVPIHEAVVDPDTGVPLRFRPENVALRDSILRVVHRPGTPARFACEEVAVRPVPQSDVAFETAWREFREGRIHGAARDPA